MLTAYHASWSFGCDWRSCEQGGLIGFVLLLSLASNKRKCLMEAWKHGFDIYPVVNARCHNLMPPPSNASWIHSTKLSRIIVYDRRHLVQEQRSDKVKSKLVEAGSETSAWAGGPRDNVNSLISGILTINVIRTSCTCCPSRMPLLNTRVPISVYLTNLTNIASELDTEMVFTGSNHYKIDGLSNE